MFARCLVFLLALLIAPAVLAHAALKEASPAADAMLETTPAQIRLRFNEPLEAAFSKITLADAQGTLIATPVAGVEATGPETLLLALPVLAPGSYQVNWSTLTKDGHRTRGSYRFHVK